MKIAVIAPLGMSPPVVTSFIRCIDNVRDLVVLTTTDKRVKQGYELIRIAMKLNYPKTRVHEVEMPIAGRVIRNQKEKFGSEIVYLNIAGGRKNMCVTLSLLGQFLNVDGIFHVITSDIKIVNEMLENLRLDIKKIYLAEDDEEKVKIYKEKENYFDSLLFPNAEVIRIPTIPISIDYVKRIITALFNERIGDLTALDRELLMKHGLIERIGSKYRVTDFGKRFAEALVR